MSTLFSRIERLSLNIKLIAGFSIGILIAVPISINALASLERMEARMNQMYERDLLGITHIKDANLNLIFASRDMRHMLIAQDEATRTAALANIKRSRERLLSELEEARKRMHQPETIARYEQFQRDLNLVLVAIEKAIGMIQREQMLPSPAAQFITTKEFAATVKAANSGFNELSHMKEQSADAALAQVRKESERTQQTVILLILVGIVLAGGLGVIVGVSIRLPSQRLSESVQALANGKVDTLIPHTDYPNEVGVMARAIAVLQGIYRQADAQHWVKQHVADISTALQQAEDLRSLTQTAVSKLAPAIGAGHGAFYVEESGGRYQLLASYGYRERKHLSNSFAVGEGLVGQCVMEKSAILLSAPRDYIRINSGLGEGPPACITVLPVIMGDRVLGVLEMASFEQFDERHKALLDALLPTLAASMEILDRNLKTRSLLADTQAQAERMEKQAAQLEEQSVELEAQQAEMLETEHWFRSIIEVTQEGIMVADADGYIQLANPAAERIFGYAPGELAGEQIEQLVPDRVRAKHAEKRAHFMSSGRSWVLGEDRHVTGKRKDGVEVPVEVALALLPPRGKRGACVSVMVRPLRQQ